MANVVPVTFNMLREQFQMISYNATITTQNKSEIVRILAGLGGRLVVIENHYIRQKQTSGLQTLDTLQRYNITPEITADHKLLYGRQEVKRVEDMDQIINAKLKAGKIKVCISLDYGFARYINWFRQYYNCSLDHVMARLIQHGMALTLCTSSHKDWSPQDLKEFEKIDTYTVTYDPDGKGILLTKPEPISQMDFSNFKKIPAGTNLQAKTKTTNRQVRGASV